MRRLLHLVVSCVVLSGCYGPGEGVEVPVDEIYFPVGLSLDTVRSRPADGDVADAEFLYVVSSDFDLQYNGGAVQSYDLHELEQALPQPCDEPGGLCSSSEGRICVNGDRADADRLLHPGRCKSLHPSAYKADSVKIGAFATDAIIRQPDEQDGSDPRLFIPVRGDSTLHFLDLDARGGLHCGQENNDGACDDAHRAGRDPDASSRGLKLNVEPFAIDADRDARTIVVTNQTTGTASLFVTPAGQWRDGPKLTFALASDAIPARPVGVVNIPRTRRAELAQAGGDPASEQHDSEAYMLTFRDSAQVRLVRFSADVPSSPERAYLADGGGVPIDANSVGSDSRGIAVDAFARRAAEARCAEQDVACLESAALVPLDVYVTNRAPASLLIGRTRPPEEYPNFFETVPLTAGPSRVVVGQVKSPSGDFETRVFVVCFDSRRVFIYDPQRRRMEAEIFTGRGPHALAVDTKRQLLYVGHFTDSYIGVYSLDLAHPDTYGTLLGSLGEPKAPRSSK